MIAAQICPTLWRAKIQSILMNNQRLKKKSFLHAAGWKYFYGSAVHSGPCWSLLWEAQQHLPSQSHAPSLTFSLPETQAGAQLGQRWPWMAPCSGQLCHSGDWTHPPQQEQGWDLRLWCLSARIVIPWCKTKVTEQGIVQRCLVFSSLCVTAGQMETSWVI